MKILPNLWRFSSRLQLLSDVFSKESTQLFKYFGSVLYKAAISFLSSSFMMSSNDERFPKENNSMATHNGKCPPYCSLWWITKGTLFCLLHSFLKLCIMLEWISVPSFLYFVMKFFGYVRFSTAQFVVHMSVFFSMTSLIIPG